MAKATRTVLTPAPALSATIPPAPANPASPMDAWKVARDAVAEVFESAALGVKRALGTPGYADALRAQADAIDDVNTLIAECPDDNAWGALQCAGGYDLGNALRHLTDGKAARERNASAYKAAVKRATERAKGV